MKKAFTQQSNNQPTAKRLEAWLWLRAWVALPGDPCLIPSICMTPVPEDLTCSSGLIGHQACMWCRQTHSNKCSHIHEIKINKTLKK